MVRLVNNKASDQSIENILGINNEKSFENQAGDKHIPSEDNSKQSSTSKEGKTESSKEEAPSSEPWKISSDEEAKKWGYDMYPERRGAKYEPSWFRKIFMFEGREHKDKLRCEVEVYKTIKESPLVKLMMNALKSSGCEIDIRRHICCEMCDKTVTGGYDPLLNQVVVCQNNIMNPNLVEGILVHEMIHMFDYCRNNLDFKNLEHLACTEIRAANLTHCSFLSAWLNGDVSVFNIKKQHEFCVRNKALASVMSVRQVSQDEAMAAVDRVFPYCYNDMEPIGRRIRRGSTDKYKAFMEAKYYGY